MPWPGSPATARPTGTRTDVDLISRQPVDDTVKGLPQKRAYGSDFPFRNVGQLDGVTALGQANSLGDLGRLRRIEQCLGVAGHGVHACDIRPMARQ